MHIFIYLYKSAIMRPIASENYAQMQIDAARDDRADDTVRPHPGTQNWSIVRTG